MKRFIEGEDRSQSTLLPECLDDFIGEDNPVRPAYHPAVLLKLYIYGYLNQRFVAMCRPVKIFSQAIVAIDGGKFKAPNSLKASRKAHTSAPSWAETNWTLIRTCS